MNPSEEKPLLDPPTFQLPSDYENNPDDYEIWSLRVPVKFDMSSLHETTLNFNLSGQDKKDQENGVTAFEIDGKKYSFVMGSLEEIENLRMLIPAQDLDEEEENDGKAMIPLNVPFQKNFHLFHVPNSKTKDIDLAPSLERAPGVDMEAIQMRIPYTKIEQVQGLKRRWQVPGATAAYDAPDEEFRMKKNQGTPKKKTDDSGKKEAKSHKKKKTSKSQ